MACPCSVCMHLYFSRFVSSFRMPIVPADLMRPPYSQTVTVWGGVLLRVWNTSKLPSFSLVSLTGEIIWRMKRLHPNSPSLKFKLWVILLHIQFWRSLKENRAPRLWTTGASCFHEENRQVCSRESSSKTTYLASENKKEIFFGKKTLRIQCSSWPMKWPLFTYCIWLSSDHPLYHPKLRQSSCRTLTIEQHSRILQRVSQIYFLSSFA